MQVVSVFSCLVVIGVTACNSVFLYVGLDSLRKVESESGRVHLALVHRLDSVQI
jgi:hypothetical protein